jgi:amidase
LCAERDAYRTMYAKAWTDTSKQGKEIDVILCPPSFGAACPHERSRYWGYTCQYRRGPTDAFYERSD